MRYEERHEERAAGHEEWLCLARCHFQWLSDLAPGAAPNPTYLPGRTPAGEAAVEHKVLRTPRLHPLMYSAGSSVSVCCLHPAHAFILLLAQES